MKVSEITSDTLVEYLRLDESEELLEQILTASIRYVQSYTGLTVKEIDQHEDITHAVLVLCQDMHDNRSLYVDKSNINKVVEAILGLHSVNLL